MSQYLNICNGPCTDTIKDPVINFPYELDDFQKHAIYHISRDEDVLVTAPTGAGKSTVSTYGLAHALRKGQKAIYTSPIKSLSNQKFKEMKETPELGGNIGILTGDIKFNPDAPIMIMTTEILRNLLYLNELKQNKTEALTLSQQSQTHLDLDEIGCVVFDEVHYINDPDRGKVWEETLIMLPPRITLVMLSATIDKPEKFAGWLAELKKKPVNLIPTSFRPVPLTHWIWVKREGVVHGSGHKDEVEPETHENRQLYKIMTDKNQFIDSGYDEAIVAFKDKWFSGKKPHIKGHTTQKTNILMNHMQVKSSELNPFLQYLQHRKLLPALIFVLSRKNCEIYASTIQVSLVTPEEVAEIGKIFDSHMHPYFKQYSHLSQYQAIRSLLDKGIGVHHSGLIPVLKEIIEILFSKSLVKLLFCTETFAVGVNMPTKTVVFTEMQKYDGNLGRKRLLRTDEYMQMSGRAGRRGKDKIGTVIHFPIRELPSKSELSLSMTGQNPEIKSKFTLNYQFVLKILLTKEGSNNLLDFIDSSLLGEQQREQLQVLEAELEHLSRDYLADNTIDEVNMTLIKEYLEANKQLETKKLTNRQIKAYRDHLFNILKTPGFKEKYKIYLSMEESTKKVQEVKNKIYHLLNVDLLELVDILTYLRQLDYIQSDLTFTPNREQISQMGKEVLQLKGLMAAKISECNEILLTEIVTQGLLDDLTLPELAAILAIFADSAEEEDDVSINELVPSHLRARIDKIKKISGSLLEGEDYYDIHLGTDWQIYLQFILPAYYWAQGDTLSKIYTVTETYEGNFIKGILKISHIAETLVIVAEIANMTKLATQAEELSKMLIRDEVTVNSLYIK